MSSPSDLLRTSPNNYHTIDERAMPERSCSPLSVNAISRRLRSAFTPPRSRRQKQLVEDERRPRSATASPSVGLTTSSDLIGTMPPRLKTCSCGDLERLENIFEPRLAPYTPPLKLRRGLDTTTSGSSLKGLSDEQIEKLETKLFEPRDAACTPPLCRKAMHKSLSMDEDEDIVNGRSQRSNSEPPNQTSQSSGDSFADEAGKNEIVSDLHRIVVQLRAQAKASSQDAAKQLSGLIGDTSSEVTIRELARLQQYAVLSSRQPSEIICC